MAHPSAQQLEFQHSRLQYTWRDGSDHQVHRLDWWAHLDTYHRDQALLYCLLCPAWFVCERERGRERENMNYHGRKNALTYFTIFLVSTPKPPIFASTDIAANLPCLWVKKHLSVFQCAIVGSVVRKEHRAVGHRSIKIPHSVSGYIPSLVPGSPSWKIEFFARKSLVRS